MSDDINKEIEKQLDIVMESLNDSALFYYKYLETDELMWKEKADICFDKRQVALQKIENLLEEEILRRMDKDFGFDKDNFKPD